MEDRTFHFPIAINFVSGLSKVNTPKRLCIPRDFGGIGKEQTSALGGCDVLAEAEDAHALDGEDFGKFAMAGMVRIDLHFQVL
jgi:hypothetical protein